MIRNKRGQAKKNIIVLAFFGLLVILAFFVGGWIMNLVFFHDQNLVSAITTSFGDVINVFGAVPFYDSFGALLGFDKAGNDGALVILAFILLTIIIISTLDSVNIFGNSDDTSGQWINFFVGVIVSIIGVRYMPQNLWSSLTAPSSALIATILVGIPFFALFFVTMKLKSTLVSKLLWIFYFIFMTYLILVPEKGGFSWTNNSFMYIYIVFLVLAGAMMFFDSTVRNYFNSEKVKLRLQDMMSKKGILDRKELREEMKKWQEIMVDPDASKEEKSEARKMLRELGDLSKETVSS